jgi:hypothetical protein
MKLNMIALPHLDQAVLDAVFSACLGDEDTLAGIHDESTRDFAGMILAIAGYNVKYRPMQLKKLVLVMQETLGDTEADPEGFARVLGAVMAIKEMYNMRVETLKAIMRQVTVLG